MIFIRAVNESTGVEHQFVHPFHFCFFHKVLGSLDKVLAFAFYLRGPAVGVRQMIMESFWDEINADSWWSSV